MIIADFIPQIRWALLLFTTAGCTQLFGCATQQSTATAPALIKELSQTPYPWNADTKDLDVVVVRDGPAIVLTNRTPAVYRKTQVWLNQQYVAMVDEIPIGSPTRFELRQFINEHEEPFPVGGLLTPEKTRPVVLAELYRSPPRADNRDSDIPVTPNESGTRYRLLVRDTK